ncbi:hypothetical protein BDV93DRAFT_519099 [Ceratobasidium sp. AG-I]|nr:hypothetical protein BDV93DRAFT_519099 [Ceratobasidium sp. AG-I]
MSLPGRRHILLLLLCASHALAQTPFDCSSVELSGVKYDLTLLHDDRAIARERQSPPTQMRDELRFNICKDLGQRSDVKSNEQCGANTRACLTTTNKKDGESDRIISVVPVALSSSKYTVQALPSDSGKGLVLTFTGGPYPDSNSKAQSLKISMFCAAETKNPDTFEYDGSEVSIKWNVVEACGPQKSGDPPKTNDPPNTGDGSAPGSNDTGGSSMGWFFFILLLIIAAYFGLGAYHNYNQYGASGWDLIPHRDFWRDVPYLIGDLVSHLFSSGRGGGRGGYQSV